MSWCSNKHEGNGTMAFKTKISDKRFEVEFKSGEDVDHYSVGEFIEFRFDNGNFLFAQIMNVIGKRLRMATVVEGVPRVSYDQRFSNFNLVG